MESNLRSKILFVHHSGEISGSFISLMQHLRSIDIDQYNPEILFLEDGPATIECKKNGITTYIKPSFRFWTCPGPNFISRGNFNNYKSLIPSISLRKLIRKIGPDLIHINDKAALNVGLSSIGLGIPIIQHIRSTFYTIQAPLNKYIQRSAISLYANLVIGITESETSEFQRQKAITIYNSLDLKESEIALKNKEITKREFGINSDCFNIGWVARYSKSKGVWDFLDLAKLLIKEHPNINMKFYLIGELPSEKQQEYDNETGTFYKVKEKLETYLHDKNFSSNIVLLGYRKDYLSIMAALDVVVNCNRLGSIGRQAFETMAVSTLCIATHRKPKTSQIISNKKNGYIVEEGDIEEIRKIIIANYQDRNSMSQITKQGYLHAKNEFSNHFQTQKIEAYYQKLINKKNE